MIGNCQGCGLIAPLEATTGHRSGITIKLCGGCAERDRERAAALAAHQADLRREGFWCWAKSIAAISLVAAAGTAIGLSLSLPSL